MKIPAIKPIGGCHFLASAAGLGALALAPGWHILGAEPRPGRLTQGVCLGVFGNLPLDLDGK